MYLVNARNRIPIRRVNDVLAYGGMERVIGMVEAMAIILWRYAGIISW